jgi:hypothetical protein
MSPNPSRLQHLFIVRLWSETVPPQLVQWRGSVTHIPSGQQFYFTTLADLNDFIQFRSEASMGEAEVPPPVSDLKSHS